MPLQIGNQYHLSLGYMLVKSKGVKTTHYILRQASLDNWHDPEVNLWMDGVTGAVLRYDLHATGPDSLFGAGEGVLSGQFLVSKVGPQMLEINVEASDEGLHVELLFGGD